MLPNVATELATDAARHIELQFQQAFTPTITLEIFVQRVPQWAILKSEFPWIAKELMEKMLPGMISTLQMAPGAVVQDIYPLAGNEAAIGHDLLADELRRGDALLSIAARNLTVAGPYMLLQGGFGVLLRKAVFISGVAENETFGANTSTGYCPPGLCWDPVSSTKLWGFVQGLARLDGLIQGSDARMQRLMQYGPWQLTRLLPNGTEALLVASGNRTDCMSPGADCVAVTVQLPNARWRLHLHKDGGWAPDWRGLMALTVVGSFVLAALLFCLMISLQRHRALLKAMFPAKVLRPLQQGKNFSEEFESVTILFSDIVSYTAISSALRPIEVAEMLNELYCQFDELVEKNGCYKVETIGDAFMVVGGCPLAEPPAAAAERVALMALDMIATAACFRSSKGHSLRIRNLASRMESSSEPMRIQVAPSTAQLLRTCESAPAFCLLPRGTVYVKGKGNMEVFFLDAAYPLGSGGAVGGDVLGTESFDHACSEPAGLSASPSGRALLRSDVSISVKEGGGGVDGERTPRSPGTGASAAGGGGDTGLAMAAAGVRQSEDDGMLWASAHLCRIRQGRSSSFRLDSPYASRAGAATSPAAVGISLIPFQVGARGSQDSGAADSPVRPSLAGLMLAAQASNGVHSGSSMMRSLLRVGKSLAPAFVVSTDAQRPSSAKLVSFPGHPSSEDVFPIPDSPVASSAQARAPAGEQQQQQQEQQADVGAAGAGAASASGASPTLPLQ
ncbi:hypothetical protein GPECTOR_17g956 [Gonium pectorale]|uniref:Guanylate cyclase domain-containing protein n=1 Tax=Gonium pectorale TaxID=33097 RepID=A0A150GKK3_GONPE|nr:hypothetical protein GPECTOR_17g956 [Gonium pectorale]|eukprot:KXZ50317.1 hypothetical protein GPECTOR_17g956 [Gonium pectorale]